MGCNFIYLFMDGMFWRYVTSCRFSSLCLWTSIKCAHLCGNHVDLFECILYIFLAWSLSFVYDFFIDGMCVVALAPATMTMSGTMFHTLVVMMLMSG